MALMFVLGFIIDTFEIIFIVIPITARSSWRWTSTRSGSGWRWG